MNALKDAVAFFVVVGFLTSCPVNIHAAEKQELIDDFYSCDTAESARSIGKKALSQPEILVEIILDPTAGSHPKENAVFFLGKLTYWGRFPLDRFQSIVLTRLEEIFTVGKDTGSIEWSLSEKSLTQLFYNPSFNAGKPIADNIEYTRSLLSAMGKRRLLSKPALVSLTSILDSIEIKLSGLDTQATHTEIQNIINSHVKSEFAGKIVSRMFNVVLSQVKNLPTKTDFSKSFFDKEILGLQ